MPHNLLHDRYLSFTGVNELLKKCVFHTENLLHVSPADLILSSLVDATGSVARCYAVIQLCTGVSVASEGKQLTRKRPMTNNNLSGLVLSTS